ncbi:Mov34/MPN/PAD-1 family protein [Aurantivibrio infirmus]
MIEHTWLLGNENFLLIEEEVIKTINSFRQLGFDPEAGGCLFGFYRGCHIHITNCTYPKQGDNRLPLRFDRKDRFHLDYAKNLYKRSKNTCTYFGEWHTHPQDNPTPSGFDYREWDKITNLRKEWKTITIVVGRKKLWVGAGDIFNPIRNLLKQTNS